MLYLNRDFCLYSYNKEDPYINSEQLIITNIEKVSLMVYKLDGININTF